MDFFHGLAFARALAAEIAPQLPVERVDAVAAQLLSGAPAAPAPLAAAPAGTAGATATSTASDEPPAQLAAAAAAARPGAAPADEAQAHAAAGDLPRLVLSHECMALGCGDAGCALCQLNPLRKCERQLQKKYLVGDSMHARCGAQIRVSLVDSQGRLLVDGQHSNSELLVHLMDGVVFRDKGGEAGMLADEDFQACVKPHNQKGEPLLVFKVPGAISKQQVRVQLHHGTAMLPDVQATVSSEALLTGRRPPFRLVVWLPQPMAAPASSSSSSGHAAGAAAAGASGAGPPAASSFTAPPLLPRLSPDVHYAVSEEFVVATRRVRPANKADVPLVDDHVSKIEHIGRETVKKLADLHAAAAAAGDSCMRVVAAAMPDPRLRSITTVGLFQELVRLAEQQGQLRQVLQGLLKLPPEKWDEAAAHAATAVVPDFRQRVWHAPSTHACAGTGLLFSCRYGAVQLRDPVCLVHSNDDGTVKLIQEQQLDASRLQMLRGLKVAAAHSWEEPHHPGWAVFNAGASDQSAAVAPLQPAAVPQQPAAPPLAAAAAAATAAMAGAAAHVAPVQAGAQPFGSQADAVTGGTPDCLPHIAQLQMQLAAGAPPGLLGHKRGTTLAELDALPAGLNIKRLAAGQQGWLPALAAVTAAAFPPPPPPTEPRD